MINKINFAQGIQQIQARPAFKAKEADTETVTAPDNSVSFKGAEALANYNKPNVMAFDKSVLEVEPLLPTIIQPDSIGSIEGEKIYGSNGKLNSIVNRVGNNTVIYQASPEFDNMIESITTIDKKSGIVIKKQRNEIEDGKYTFTGVYEYDPVTGEGIKETFYENGELAYASKRIANDRGLTQEIGYDYHDGHFYVHESNGNKNFSRDYEFNKNKELISVSEYKSVKGAEAHTEINFYNGAVISSRQSKSEVLPNNMGREVLNDQDVKPADISIYPETIEGEKTFYSNGSLESITAGNLTYNYSVEGDLVSIQDGNKLVEKFVDNSIKITEALEDNAKRTTYIDSKNGIVNVWYEKGDTDKHLRIKDGQPWNYYHYEGDKTIKNFYFNDKGMLESARGDDI